MLPSLAEVSLQKTVERGPGLVRRDARQGHGRDRLTDLVDALPCGRRGADHVTDHARQFLEGDDADVHGLEERIGHEGGLGRFERVGVEDRRDRLRRVVGRGQTRRGGPRRSGQDRHALGALEARRRDLVETLGERVGGLREGARQVDDLTGELLQLPFG
jgi:hypothetical protein